MGLLLGIEIAGTEPPVGQDHVKTLVAAGEASLPQVSPCSKTSIVDCEWLCEKQLNRPGGFGIKGESHQKVRKQACSGQLGFFQCL